MKWLSTPEGVIGIFTLRLTEENTGMQLSASPIVLPCEGGPILCLTDDEFLPDVFFASFPLDLLFKGVPISLPQPASSFLVVQCRCHQGCWLTSQLTLGNMVTQKNASVEQFSTN